MLRSSLRPKLFKPDKFIPAYMKAGYGWYDEYLASQEWQDTKDRINRKFPHSRYCWICDSTKYINLHHENYWAIPNEQFMKDVVWLCQTCHLMVHKLDNGERTVLEKEPLQNRRRLLRKKYLRKNLKPSTLWYFAKIATFRLFW